MIAGDCLTVLTDCPFCGSSNVGRPKGDYRNKWITCFDCGCDGPLASSGLDKAGKAVLLWNRRKLLQLGVF